MFDKRVQKLKEQIRKENLDGVFISSISNIEYLTGYSNFSIMEREAYLFVGHGFEYIITDGRYTEAIKKEVPHLTLFERGHKKSLEHLFEKHKKEIKALGIEEDNLTVSEHKIIKKHFKNLKHFQLGKLRSVKEKDEIAKIKKACQLGDKAFKYILQKIKAGISEKELAYELGKFIKKEGAEFSFPAIVAFGKNSSVPHHQTGDDVLGPSTPLRQAQGRSGQLGQTVLIDFGVKFENYCSDMTRTVFFGKASNRQKEIYNIVLDAQQKAVEFINSQIKLGKKIKAKEIDKVTRDYIISKGYPSIPHSLGHGIGLDVHEHPFLSDKSKEELKEGMVFSIEPGIYIPEFGGVRIEDLYILGKKGLEQVTKSKKHLIELSEI